MELDAPPDPASHPYYAGWSISPTPPQGAVGIHHPDGTVVIAISGKDFASCGASTSTHVRPLTRP